MLMKEELDQFVGKDLIDAHPVIVIGKKHRLNIVFQLALRVVMPGQETRQILVLHVTDTVCRRNVSDQFFTIYIYQSGELAYPF